MKMLHFAAALAVVALSACTTVQNALNGAETVYAKVQAYYADAPKTVYAARGGYDIALGAAVAFKKTACPSITSHDFCATVIPLLRQKNHEALAAFDAAESFVRANPTLDASALIAAATDAATAFAKIETDNGVPPASN